MKRNAGLWIDHRKAVIVTLVGKKKDLAQIDSGVEKRVRYSAAAEVGTAEDQRDRRFKSHLNRYYDRVIAALRHVDSILITGPGEAKGELEERLRKNGMGDRIATVETADKMTDAQIAAHVRSHFERRSATL